MAYLKFSLRWVKVYGVGMAFLCVILGSGSPTALANDSNDATEAVSGSCDTTPIVTAQLHRTQSSSETYQGPCGSEATDPRGYRICCGPASRAICFSDGRCSCRMDNYCEASCRPSNTCYQESPHLSLIHI